VLRWILCFALIGCGGDKKAKKVVEDAARPVDAMRVTGDADRDKLFLSVPTSRAVEDVIKRLAEHPHIAGTKPNEEVAKEIMRTLSRMGWKVGTQQFDVYFPHPKKLSITLRGDKPVSIATTEPSSAPYGNDELFAAWNAYSASGKASGALVYGNYGRSEDLATLKKAGVDPKGKVLLLRYGPLNRGAQVASAERAGAVAVIFYNDPKDDPDRPRDSVQRGTVMYYWQHAGDPLTPGVPALPDKPRKKPSEVDVLPKIPVVNVTADEAEKMLSHLGGAEAPAEFIGGFTTTYRLAKGPIAEVEVVMDNGTRAIRNVIAILDGKSPHAVILGNHFDAWGPGALDPHSGTATLIEVARGLTALQRAGWRPRRTIVLAFWDAEEPGMIGSTEWVEQQLEMLRTNAIAYFNVDTIKAGGLTVQGSPALYEHVRRCTADVTNPTTGKPFAPLFQDLGIGSDFTAFAHHAGVASLQWQSAGGPGKYSVWHSMLDDFETAKKLSDPGFTFIPAFAQVMGLCALRLADAEHLPIDYKETVAWLERAIAKLAVSDAKLDAAMTKLRDATAQAKPSDACDAALIAAERGFLDETGIAGRPWYRHLANGPDPASGYAALPLPELAAKSPKAAERLAAAIERVAAALAPCVNR
jgi:N-acetylated-alpha-linked acidic dipeptidase